MYAEPVHIRCPNTIRRWDVYRYVHLSKNDIFLHQQYWKLLIVFRLIPEASYIGWQRSEYSDPNNTKTLKTHRNTSMPFPSPVERSIGLLDELVDTNILVAKCTSIVLKQVCFPAGNGRCSNGVPRSIKLLLRQNFLLWTVIGKRGVYMKVIECLRKNHSTNNSFELEKGQIHSGITLTVFAMSESPK